MTIFSFIIHLFAIARKEVYLMFIRIGFSSFCIDEIKIVCYPVIRFIQFIRLNAVEMVEEAQGNINILSMQSPFLTEIP